MSSNPENYHQVTSPTHFQQLLSTDLNRVSVLNFWAEWAEPCKQMNEVVLALAGRYPKVLFLQIEAENQSDISESFEIESVPTIILLRGHTLLQRVSGADAQALTAAVAKFASAPAGDVQPQSKTNGVPQAAAPQGVCLLFFLFLLSSPLFSVFVSLFFSVGHIRLPLLFLFSPQETPAELETRMRSLMNQSKVVLFMKGVPDEPRCGFSRKIVGLLRDQEVEFSSFDILKDDGVRQAWVLEAFILPRRVSSARQGIYLSPLTCPPAVSPPPSPSPSSLSRFFN
ncbi:hypothetical protein D9758_013846 [Tetrapyrgos nigripes]|uniref:Thioredoxin domain-containing protein n=1 Tax=Tetrapyrgos nigripes TaxID=182062 RepID=A0A8H5FR21_9AGAR|nr:hypothetical protein D9758_013846 [Tetrapyrgos nigripes]